MRLPVIYEKNIVGVTTVVSQRQVLPLLRLLVHLIQTWTRYEPHEYHQMLPRELVTI
jgi:hypothetical protein